MSDPLPDLVQASLMRTVDLAQRHGLTVGALIDELRIIRVQRNPAFVSFIEGCEQDLDESLTYLERPHGKR